MIRGTIDRALAWVARFVLRGFFRGLEAEGLDRIPHDRPVLVVANHFNGFVDPVVLVAAFGRLPRFLAKATLWKVIIARPFLALAGVIPVARAKDGSTEGNDRTFDACHHTLAKGETVAIFPEGVTHDDPYLHHLHTGAARIALGARGDGVERITILPIGMAFDDKLALRSRVAVRVGQPIDVDGWIARRAPEAGTEVDESRRDLVDDLTEVILERLSAVSGDYGDWREAAWCRRAAGITIRSRDPKPLKPSPLPAREELAQRIADAAPEAKREVFDRLGRYALDLDQLTLNDDQVVPKLDLHRVAYQLVLSVLALVLLGPLVVTGVTVNALPYLAVRLSSARVASPVTKGTVRILVSLVVFPIAWLVFAVTNNVDSLFIWELIIAIGCGVTTVYLFERWVILYRTWRAYSVQRNKTRLVEQILPDRAKLVAAVRAATTEPEVVVPRSAVIAGQTADAD